jgi:tRNA-specific 2-thiouridylase
MLSKNASDSDKELAAKIVLTYCKSSADSLYTLTFDDLEFKASPFETRDAIGAYTL